MNTAAVVLGVIFIIGSLVVSLYARRRTRTVLDFYLAGRRIGAFANASAICGDYFSAASFLGVAAAVYVSGLDGVWFATGFAAGLVPVLLFLAAPLRRSGAFTIPEFLGMRFGSRAVRLTAVVLIQLVVFMYLVPQLLGLGETWAVAIGAALPGLTPFDTGMLVGALVMVAYVGVGGMRAATWQQIFFFWFFFSAVLMVVALAYLNGFRYLPALADLAPEPLRTVHEAAGEEAGVQWQVRDDPNRLHPDRPARFGEPGHRYGAAEQVSMVLGLALGTCGLPHIIMRHLTSPTGRLARDAGTYVVILATLYYIPAVMAGVAARALLPGILSQDSRYAPLAVEGYLKSPEQAVLILAAGLGGDVAMGFVAAGAFAAILSTMSGLLLSGAAALSHDVYAADIDPRAPERRQILVGRLAVIAIGFLGLVMGAAMRRTGVLQTYPSVLAVMVSWVFALAGAGLFPALLAAIWWPRATARGALAAMLVGGGGTLLWIGLHAAHVGGVISGPPWLEALAGLSQPSIVTVLLAALALVLGSLRSQAQTAPQGLQDLWMRMHGTAAERPAVRLVEVSGVTDPAGGEVAGPGGG